MQPQNYMLTGLQKIIEAFNIFACNGILFNHRSFRRGENFVTKKITLALSKIKLKKQNTLFLGNLSAKRDWGHAKDFVEAQWLMMQKPLKIMLFLQVNNILLEIL